MMPPVGYFCLEVTSMFLYNTCLEQAVNIWMFYMNKLTEASNADFYLIYLFYIGWPIILRLSNIVETQFLGYLLTSLISL